MVGHPESITVAHLASLILAGRRRPHGTPQLAHHDVFPQGSSYHRDMTSRLHREQRAAKGGTPQNGMVGKRQFLLIAT